MKKTAETDGTIIEFLNGSHSYDGVWFGDKHRTKEGVYWWRKILRDYVEASQFKQPVDYELDNGIGTKTILNADMEKTSVEWLIEMLIDNKYLIKNAEHLFEQAKEMEKEQRKDAQMDMFHRCNDKDYGMQYLIARELAEQYADDYGQAMPLPMPTESKAIPVLSDDIVDTNKMITDEQIDEAAKIIKNCYHKMFFKTGAEWYREQLKKNL